MHDVPPRDWLNYHGGPSDRADKRPLALERFDTAAEPYLADAWLIENLLPLQGSGVLYGAPGGGKTFAALDLALHVATGQPWRGKAIEQRGVIYLSLEGGRPFSNRLAAWRMHHGISAPLFARCAEPLNLFSTETDAERVVEAGQQFVAESGAPVGLIVIDTLNRAMPGGNENAVDDMGKLIAIAESMGRDLGAFVLIVHHSGKDSAKGSRGHSSLTGAISTELSMVDRTLTVTKQRDGEDGEQFGIALEPVKVGTTPKGRSVFSCVVVEGEISAQQSLRASQQQTVEAVRQYLDDHGQPNPSGTGWPPAGTRKITGREPFLEWFSGKQASEEESDRKKVAGRKIDRLIERGVIQQNEGFIWLV